MTMTLEQVRDLLDSALAGQTGSRVTIHATRAKKARDAIDAHLPQPAQAVDVGAGSAHRGECPVKMARAICEAIVKHQFQDEHRHGRLTLDVETFLREFNVARDSGATRALGNAQAEGWRVPDAMECPPLNLSLPVSGEYHEGYCYGWNACRAAILPTPPQPEE